VTHLLYSWAFFAFFFDDMAGSTEMCGQRFARKFVERTGITVKGNLIFFAGLFPLSLRKCDAILPRQWGQIRCQLAARTHPFLVEGHAKNTVAVVRLAGNPCSLTPNMPSLCPTIRSSVSSLLHPSSQPERVMWSRRWPSCLAKLHARCPSVPTVDFRHDQG
jgi:hypothetical protein